MASRVPPNINVALWVAERLSSDEDLRSHVQALLPRLLSSFSSRSETESIERAAALFGFTRSADALPTAIALCDELDRVGRVDEALSFTRAIAAQLPTDAMLDLLGRKGMRQPYAPFCLRALLKLDRKRAAALLCEPSQGDIPQPVLRSLFMDLSPDERVEALKEIYCTRPSPPKALLDSIERVCKAFVRSGEGNSFVITVPGASRSFRNLPAEACVAWLNAKDRTAVKSILEEMAEFSEEVSS